MRIDSPNNQAPSRALIAISITLLMDVWAINFQVVKIGLRHLPALTFASFRLVAAGIFMLLVAPLCRLLPIFREPSSSPNNVIASAARVPLSSSTSHQSPVTTCGPSRTFPYLGFFGVSVNQLCFTLGLRYTSVTHSSIIVGMAPIYTLALALLFRLEHLTWAKALGMAIAFSGVATLASSTGMNHHSPTLLGDAITMCGSLGFAMYVVPRQARRRPLQRPHHDDLKFHLRRVDHSAYRHPASAGEKSLQPLPGRFLASLGLHWLHRSVQFHPRLSFLLLAPPPPRSLATRLIFLLAPRLRLRPEHPVPWRTRLLARTPRRRSGSAGVYAVESSRR
jgi:hypothetical protein